jgi:hypothetical protein
MRPARGRRGAAGPGAGRVDSGKAGPRSPAHAPSPPLALALLVACGPAPRERFTLEQQLAATIAGIPDARAWGRFGPGGLSALGFAPAEVAARREGRLDYLALSSGGPAGAFGAGVLVGWGEAGTRPEFDVVTGVSAGALLAPFAFVGAEGDAALRELWAEGAARELGRGLNPVGLLNGQGLVDRGPLEDLLATHVDDGLVAAIARGHREGRRLLVVTTNLDAQRPVIWNLGAIAASGRPGRRTSCARCCWPRPRCPWPFRRC